MIAPLKLFYGTDPEAFLSRGGKVIGSEKVIPPTGHKDLIVGVIQDGVQVEFNPQAAGTVELLSKNLATVLGKLQVHLTQKFPDVTLDWSELIEVDIEELMSLKEENRVLGCQPSENAYGVNPIKVGQDYRKRSAGGHLHFGQLPKAIWSPAPYGSTQGPTDNRRVIIPLLDIFLGNTLVLLNRDPAQAERRQNYGRAGEFRIQPHGVEYRTPSNFWLRHSALMDLAFGLGNLAISLCNMTCKYDTTEEEEMAPLIDIDKFRAAIDLNDYVLARDNFRTIVPFLRKHLPEVGFPLNPKNIDQFLSFADAVKEKGLATYFPDSPEVFWSKAEFITFPALLAKFF